MTIKTDDTLLAHELKLIEEGRHLLNGLTTLTRRRNDKWWTDLHTGQPIERNVGELLMLQVSELAEAVEDSPQYNLAIMEIVKTLARAMEGHRKNKMDDKLTHRKMVEVEMADTIIRIFDFCGGLGYDLGGAFAEKMEFNRTRHDHTHEARKAVGGKAY